MQPADILSTLRRRWPLVAICFALGLVIAFPAASGTPAPQAGAFVSSSSVLVKFEGTVPQALVTALATSEVPERVADELGIPGGALAAANSVSVEAGEDSGVITFTAKAGDADAAVDLANAYARSTLAAVTDQQVSAREQIATTLGEELDRVRQEVADAEARLAADPTNTLLEVQRDGLEDRESSTVRQLREALAAIPGQDVSLLRAASVARPDSEAATVTPLRRFALFAILGAAVGILAALAVERFDPRPHRRDDLEAAFRMRTIAVIPYTRPAGRTRRHQGVLQRATEPAALAAFRTLRTALLVTRPYSLIKPIGSPAPEAQSLPTRRRVVLVASVRDSYDSTVVSAGLASALAESGTRVLAVDGDHLRGRLSAMLGLGPGPGFVDLLERTTLRPSELAQSVQLSTGSPRIAAIPCGVTNDYPGASPDRVNGVLDPAREFADVVVIDGAPILDAVQSLDLLPVVDGVLLVAAPGEVLRDEAAQVAEIFDNLGAKVFGLVLVEPTRHRLGARRVSQAASSSGRATPPGPHADAPTDEATLHLAAAPAAQHG
jgi:Mrp family chromosome partitioning ATPase/capsular polysaccharide biosynthesis protein